MRSPAALLLVSPLLACFADGGSTTFMTSSVMTGASTGSEGPGTEAGTEAGTGAPTTTATTTVTTTTGETTTATTADVSTGAVGNCQLAPECEAGAVETGGPCDSCGVLRRTCQADCTWTPMACEQDLTTCEYWVLPSNEFVWQRVPVDPAAQFAPKETVLAAVGLAPQQQIYVLTANNYHVLSTVTRTWLASGPRDVLLPQIAGLPLHLALEVTVEPPDTVVNVLAGTEVFAYTIVDGSDVNFDAQVPCCGPNWEGQNAPLDPYALRDGWGRIGDPEGWIPFALNTICDVPDGTPIYGYGVIVGNGLVYPQDIGYCFDFYPPIPYDQFTPFAYPGRPANELVGGTAWVDGLWVFRGE
jgi:hypothetical protein